MRVLILQRYMEYYSGAENVVNKLSSCLKKKGVPNVVAALNVSDNVRKICEGVEFIVPSQKYPAVFRSTNFWASLGILREIYELRKIVKQHSNKYDIINVHNFPATWALFGLKKNKPVVWMCNETPDFYSNPKLSFLIKIIRAIGMMIDRFIINSVVDIIVTADNANAIKVKNVYSRPSEIIHYGIDTDIFSPVVKNFRDETRKKYNINPRDFVLIQSGVISPQKNQIESIKSLLKLKHTVGIPVQLILAGNDNTPYKKEVMRFISENKIESNVIFTGHIDKNELARLYGASDLALFPVKEQGGWLSPFEALSCGIPAIISDTMGAADLLKNYDFCKITNNFESGVVEVFNFYQEYLKKAKAASDWIKNNLTWENYTDGFIKIFSSLLKS